MLPDPLDLLQGVRGEVAFPAVRTTDERHTLDQKRRTARPERACGPADPRSLLSTDIADHDWSSLVERYTVMITSRPVGPIFATTLACWSSRPAPSTTYLASTVCRSLCLSTILPVSRT